MELSDEEIEDTVKFKKKEKKVSNKSVDIELSEEEAVKLIEKCKNKTYDKPTEIELSEEEEEEEEVDETAIARDIKNRHIYVSLVQKSMTTKMGKKKKKDRVYNSKHPCPFCPKPVSNFSHHITTCKHNKEPAVQDILETNDEQTRKIKIQILRLKAAHFQNLKTLDKKKGEVFLRRRPKVEDFDSEEEKTIDIEKYGPCPKCLGWITLLSIKRHIKNCISSEDLFLSNASKGLLLVQSNLLCNRLPVEASQSLIKEVFPIMVDDNVCTVAKNDSLIINLGNQWMLRNKGNEIMRKYYTSSVMRLAAKLKIALQFLDNSKEELDEYLRPCNFNVVVKGALRCCFPADADEEELKSPSNAVKLGHDVKRMVSAKLAQALMTDDATRKKEAEEFLQLMEIEWSLRVTKLARLILNERAFNKENKLPLPEDVKKLSAYMQCEITRLDLMNKTLPNYKKVAVLTLSRITLFNRRRCHEVQALKISSYQKRKSGEDELSLELRGELTPFEKNLLIRQEVVVIRGKTGKGVPVILPGDTKKALQFLTDTDTRMNVGVPTGNPYVFGSVGAGVFRAYDAIRSVALAADLQYPNLIRTSNMRKYMATMLQALNTNEAERQWVLDHLGHTMDVHKIHYRMTSDVLERVDVAKILLIQDLGLVGQYRGKKLEDIQLDKLMEDSKNEVEPPSQDGAATAHILTQAEEDDYVPEIYDFEPNDNEEDEEEETDEKPKRKKTKKPVKRQKWSVEEVNELEQLFKKDFDQNKCPSQKRVETAIKLSRSNNGLIYNRNRDTIKKKVSNMMVKTRNQKNSVANVL